MVIRDWQEDFLRYQELRGCWLTPRMSGKTQVAVLKGRNLRTAYVVPLQSFGSVLIERRRMIEELSKTPALDIFTNNSDFPFQDIQNYDQVIVDEASSVDISLLRDLEALTDIAIYYLATPNNPFGDEFSEFLIDTQVPVSAVHESNLYDDREHLLTAQRTLSPEHYMAECLGMYLPEVEKGFNWRHRPTQAYLNSLPF